MRVIITSPSLNTTDNVSGVSAVTGFITSHNKSCQYVHFTLGKRDGESRNLRWLGRLLASYVKWFGMLFAETRALVHFNLALEQRSLIRDLPLILAARGLRRRLIVHIHGGELFASKPMPSWLKHLTAIGLAGGPIIVLSEAEREVIEKRFPRAEVVVLPNCVDLNDAASFERSYDDNEAINLLFLGRISAPKGIHVLYDALAAAAAKGVRFRFVMAGAVPMRIFTSRGFGNCWASNLFSAASSRVRQKNGSYRNARYSCFRHSLKGCRWRYWRAWHLVLSR